MMRLLFIYAVVEEITYYPIWCACPAGRMVCRKGLLAAKNMQHNMGLCCMDDRERQRGEGVFGEMFLLCG